MFEKGYDYVDIPLLNKNADVYNYQVFGANHAVSNYCFEPELQLFVDVPIEPYSENIGAMIFNPFDGILYYALPRGAVAGDKEKIVGVNANGIEVFRWEDFVNIYNDGPFGIGYYNNGQNLIIEVIGGPQQYLSLDIATQTITYLAVIPIDTISKSWDLFVYPKSISQSGVTLTYDNAMIAYASDGITTNQIPFTYGGAAQIDKDTITGAIYANTRNNGIYKLVNNCIVPTSPYIGKGDLPIYKQIAQHPGCVKQLKISASSVEQATMPISYWRKVNGSYESREIYPSQYFNARCSKQPVITICFDECLIVDGDHFFTVDVLPGQSSFLHFELERVKVGLG